MLMRKRSSMAVSSSNTTNRTSNFATARLLLGFSAKPASDTDLSASPTSILETRLFSPTVNPFFTDTKLRSPWHGAKSRAVGLGIIDALHNEKPEIHKKCGNTDSRMVLFGSQLKIQIPSMQPTSVTTAGLVESPGLPIEFGVKNKNSQLALLSPARRSPIACSGDMSPPSTDMELSEDYTCVIAHGPNPRTTHIFDNCIVESCSTSHSSVSSPREKRSSAGDSVSFLAFCHVCKKSLGQEKGIFNYRGEKAFCSNECPHNEVFHEGMEKASSGSSMAP